MKDSTFTANYFGLNSSRRAIVEMWYDVLATDENTIPRYWHGPKVQYLEDIIIYYVKNSYYDE